jgi:hypothetical protein
MHRFMRVSLSCAAVALMAAGCTSYYKVTDPTTGKIYYTTELKSKSSGATTLKDARTGDAVVLQNSEVDKINKEEFEMGKNAPEPAPQPAGETKSSSPWK